MHFTSSIPSIWLSSVIEDTTRYIIFATGTWAILWVALKSLLANRIIRPSSPPPKQLLTEFAFSLRSIAVYATVGVGMEFLARTGFYPLGDISAQWGPLWFVIALVLMIIGHDAYFYWAHRIMHDPRLFRHFHRRHHLSLNPSPFTAYSFAIGEALVMVMFVVLWPLVIPTPWPVIGLFMLHQIFRNTLGHSGYELMPARANGRPLLDFLTTTTHHDQHHAKFGCNYGLYFTWWDRWMGTEHPEYLAAYQRAVRFTESPAPQPAANHATQ